VFRSVGAGVALLAGLATGACGDDGPDELAGAVRTPALDVAGVSLPAVDGAGGEEPLTMQAPPDELYLIYFGYTSCPDVCPTTMSDISIALEDLPDDLADRVTVAMATVDPERDTGEVVAGYLDHFFDRSVALRTTDPDALAAAADAFGVQWEVEEHAPGEAYDVAHSAVTYVVDDTGTVVVEWPFGFDSEAMTSDLRILLEEEHA
jgi:protein SCO1/2